MRILSKIVNVTVYRSGARITRRSKVVLGKGQTQVQFTGLSSTIFKESIQVRYSKGTQCVKMEYWPVSEKKEETKNIYEESFRKEEAKLTEQIRELDVAVSHEEKKRNMLEKLMTESSIQVASVADLNEYLLYYERSDRELQEAVRKLEREKKQLKNQYQELVRKRKSHIVLEMESGEEGEYTIELSYFDSAAEWQPYYEIVAEDIGAPVSITLKGTIKQYTGEDWENVRLQISTGDLRVSNNQPELRPWYLSQKHNSFPVIGAGLPQVDTTCLMMPELYQEQQRPAVEHDKTVATEFELPDQYTIKSKKDADIISVMSKEFSASYIFSTVPKAEKNVYLKAVLNNKDIMDFMECDANIYFASSFVGAVHISPEKMKEKIDFSFGRNSQLKVDRKKLYDYTTEYKRGNISRNEKHYEIYLRNGREATVFVEVQDQLPVSGDSGTTVEIIDVTGAEIEQSTGKLTWKYKLEPGQEIRIPVKFAVSYPKNSMVKYCL